MNIVFVNSTHKWGGVKTWTLDVALGLQQRGHKVYIIGRHGPFVDKAQELGLSVQADDFGFDFNPALICRLITFFKDKNITQVVVNVGKDMRSAGIAARLMRIPVVHRVGLAGDMENRPKVRWLHKWVKPRLLVPCEQIRQGLLQELPYLNYKEIRVIHTCKQTGTISIQNAHKPLRFISSSQLNADKGHADVLRILADKKQKGMNFIYHIVGTGDKEEELKSIAEKLGLTANIIWHGFQKKVRHYLRQADVFILPSYREGLPNSLLEAMAEGLICVARNVGGVGEVWPQTMHNLLVDNNRELDDALSDLLDMDGNQIMEQKKLMRDYCCDKFNYESYLNKLELFFKAG